MLQIDQKCAALMHAHSIIDNPICRWTGGWGNVVEVELEMGRLRRWSMYLFGLVDGCTMAQLIVDAYRKGKLSREDFMQDGMVLPHLAANKYVGASASQMIQDDNDELFAFGGQMTNLHPVIDHCLALRYDEMRKEIQTKLEALDGPPSSTATVHSYQDLLDSVRGTDSNVVARDRAEEDAASLAPA